LVVVEDLLEKGKPLTMKVEGLFLDYHKIHYEIGGDTVDYLLYHIFNQSVLLFQMKIENDQN
jgi:hypothetical protein